MSNDDSFLTLPENFGGRVGIHPNAANSVYVDGSGNSANGRDDDPRVCFITYRGKDYTHSSNWTLNADGVWYPVHYEVHQRGSFGMARAPKTYAAAIIKMIGDRLAVWYNDTNGRQAMNRAALRNAENEVHGAEGAVADAQQALNEAIEALHAAERKLSAAQLATVTLHAPQS